MRITEWITVTMIKNAESNSEWSCFDNEGENDIKLTLMNNTTP